MNSPVSEKKSILSHKKTASQERVSVFVQRKRKEKKCIGKVDVPKKINVI